MLPLSRMIVYANAGNAADTYFGLYTDSAFSYNNLKAVLNPATPFAQQSYYKVYHYRYQGKEYLLPAQPIAISSYKEIYEKGMMYGTDDTGPNLFDSTVGIASTLQNAIITDTNGNNWRIRCMKGAPDYSYGSGGIVTNNPNFNPPTEFEVFTYSIYNNLIDSVHNPVYQLPYNDQIAKGALSSSSTRRWCIVQGTDMNRTTPRIIGRGRYDVTGTADYTFAQFCTSSIVQTVTTSGSFWWPIFEKI